MSALLILGKNFRPFPVSTIFYRDATNLSWGNFFCRNVPRAYYVVERKKIACWHYLGYYQYLIILLCRVSDRHYFLYFLQLISPGTPSSKARPWFLIKIFFSKIRLWTGCSNRSNFVQTVAVFGMGYGCAQNSARERIRMVLFYGE